MAWCESQLLGARLASPRFLLCGHSRGAKIAALAALQPHAQSNHNDNTPSAPLAGLVLLDPADSSYDTLPSDRFPSVLRLLNTVEAEQGECGLPPTLIIGAGLNRDCIPPAGAYPAWWAVCEQAPRVRAAALIEVRGVGHFDFLDRQTLLQQSACRSGGEVTGAALRGLSRKAMVQWAQLCLSRPAAVTPAVARAVLSGVNDQLSAPLSTVNTVEVRWDA
jgi:pimeloyl-ACP methyl ester carboxylesterase